MHRPPIWKLIYRAVGSLKLVHRRIPGVIPANYFAAYSFVNGLFRLLGLLVPALYTQLGVKQALLRARFHFL